jgi:hypothetical protein
MMLLRCTFPALSPPGGSGVGATAAAAAAPGTLAALAGVVSAHLLLE